MLFNVLKFFVQLAKFLPHLPLFLFVVGNVGNFFLQFCQSFFIAHVFTFSVFLTLLLFDLLLFVVELEQWLLFDL